MLISYVQVGLSMGTLPLVRLKEGHVGAYSTGVYAVIWGWVSLLLQEPRDREGGS